MVASAQSPASGQPVVASVVATKKGPPISAYVYGQFLEHGGSLVYSSLRCELLDDRKFYYAVQPKPAEDPNTDHRGFGDFGLGRRRNAGPGRWNSIGPVDSVVMDTSNPFIGEHTPLIKLSADEPRGIRQTGINFMQGVIYDGRIQLAGDASVKVSINIVWGTNADAVSQTVPLGGLSADYKKITCSFKAEHSGAAQFEIVGTGTGTLHVGAVSLMLADNLEDGVQMPLPCLRVFAPAFTAGPAATLFPPMNGVTRLATRTNARRSMTRYGARSNRTKSARMSL